MSTAEPSASSPNMLGRAPRVSVVIPTYNQPAMLCEALETVFAQTYADYEVVIVDDGGGPETGEAVGRIAGGRDNVRLIRQANGGVGAARNRGIDEARGELIALMDHDDWWRPGKLAEQVSYLDSHPQCASTVCEWAYSSTPETPGFGRERMVDERGVILRPLKELAEGNMFILSSALMFRRAAAAGLRYGTERKSIEDVPFQTCLFARGGIGVSGDAIQMIYRVHDANFSGQASFFYNGLKLLRKLQREGMFRELKSPHDDDLDAFLARTAHTTITRQMVAGLRGKALEVLLTESPALLRHGYWKFLLVGPAFLVGPQRAIEKRWKQEGIPTETNAKAHAGQRPGAP